MGIRAFSLTLATALLLCLPVRAAEPVAIGVMEFTGSGLTPSQVEALADLLADEISRMGDVRVIGKSDILAMLKLEQQKRLVDCSTKECISEVGGALGARWMVSGSVNKFGQTYLLNLKLFDVERMQAIGRVSRRVTGGEEMLLTALTGAVHEMFARVAERIGLVMAETVTVAARYPQPLEQSPSAVTVITREDIETSGASTIPDLLRLVPGMDVVILSPNNTAITSRLFWTYENNLYLVLIDGREANVDLLGQAPWEIQPITLEDIERIEVIRGPGSALYGANAFAGVVSITTRALAEKTSAWARVSGGETGMLGAGARASTRIGRWGLSLSSGANLANHYYDTREPASELWRTRSVVEYRPSETHRFLLDGSVSQSEGVFSTGMGIMDQTTRLYLLRLAYESEYLQGHVFWHKVAMDAILKANLDYGEWHVADFIPILVDTHTIDLQVQWTLPRFHDPLQIITGAFGRTNGMSCEQMLDAETYTDIGSSRFHKPGIERWELRAGAFVHGEWAAADWATVTGGLRLDYNTDTEWFVSPRLAAVFRPAAGHHVRLGVGRAFRKPAFLELHVHPMVTLENSTMPGLDPDRLQEFMTRVLGNSSLGNEELLSFEAGYQGRFLDGILGLSLDLYYSQHRNMIEMTNNLVEKPLWPGGPLGPDLDKTTIRFEHQAQEDRDIFGWELTVRVDLSRYVSLLAAWSHKEIFFSKTGKSTDYHPKNLITLGGRFRTDWNLLGSLYLFSRSEFRYKWVDNPDGILEPYLEKELPNVLLVMSRLGYKLSPVEGLDMEAGVKVFLPVSPFQAPHFRYHEHGGGVTADGRVYGGEQLRRVVTMYLEGAY